MKKSGKPLSSQLFGVGQQSFSKKRLWRQINGKFATYLWNKYFIGKFNELFGKTSIKVKPQSRFTNVSGQNLLPGIMFTFIGLNVEFIPNYLYV